METYLWITLFTTNKIICELIFEENFNELDQSKWKVISEKANCAQVQDLKFNERDPLICNTNNEVNLRTISGKLAITAKHETYFDSDFTSATILSKRSFKLNTNRPSLTFEVRAALPFIDGLLARVYLISYSNKELSMVDSSVDILKYDTSIWSSLVTRIVNNANYTLAWPRFEMSFQDNIFTWRFNSRTSYIYKATENVIPPGINNFKFSPNTNSDFYLVVTLNVDKSKFDPLTGLKLRRHGICYSFLVDYIRVYQNDLPENNPDKFDESDNPPKICDNIDDLAANTYIKFVPENFSLQLFQDEFDGNHLQNDKWFIKEGEEQCKSYLKEGEKYCDSSDNIKVSKGKLKLFVKSKRYFGSNFTGATIATMSCFKSARVEIRAKLPIDEHLEFDLAIQAYQDGCNQGDVRGRADIIKKISCSNCFTAGLNTSRLRSFNNRLDNMPINFNEYQVYGIEFRDSYIQWFINDRVVYQTNRLRDQNGKQIAVYDQAYYLPFISAFNVLIRIGAQKYINTPAKLNWTSEALEVDYIRVYGQRKTEPKINSNETTDSILIIILSICLVLFTLLVLIIVIVVLWRRQKKSATRLQSIYYDNNIFETEYYDYISPNNYDTNYYEPVEIPLQNSAGYVEILNQFPEK